MLTLVAHPDLARVLDGNTATPSMLAMRSLAYLGAQYGLLDIPSSMASGLTDSAVGADMSLSTWPELVEWCCSCFG